MRRYFGQWGGDNCGARLDISKNLAQSVVGEWQELSASLRCFVDSGLNARAVNAPVLLETNGSMTLSITEISVTKGTQECP